MLSHEDEGGEYHAEDQHSLRERWIDRSQGEAGGKEDEVVMALAA